MCNGCRLCLLAALALLLFVAAPPGDGPGDGGALDGLGLGLVGLLAGLRPGHQRVGAGLQLQQRVARRPRPAREATRAYRDTSGDN